MLPFFWLYIWASSICEQIFYFLQDPAKVLSHFLSVHLLFPPHPKPTPYCPMLDNEATCLVSWITSPPQLCGEENKDSYGHTDHLQWAKDYAEPLLNITALNMLITLCSYYQCLILVSKSHCQESKVFTCKSSAFNQHPYCV